jgi:hypothetical protein
LIKPVVERNYYDCKLLVVQHQLHGKLSWEIDIISPNHKPWNISIHQNHPISQLSKAEPCDRARKRNLIMN